MARVLITGVSGLLGSYLALAARQRHQVFGVYHRHPITLEDVRTVGADLSQAGAARELVETHRPDWVVHCAAATDVDRCEREPDWARKLNVEMSEFVAGACNDAGARLAHISTDAVFDGQTGDYREHDPAEPINVYGRTKLEGERAALSADPEALVVRTNLFGWSPDGRRGLAQFFVDRLEADQACPGFTDVTFSPLYASDLAEAVLGLLERGASGTMHLAGRTCLSKHEFGVRLARMLGLNPQLVEPASVDELGLVATRPKRLCLVSDRAEQALGAELPELDSGLKRLAGERETWRAVRRSSPEVAHD